MNDSCSSIRLKHTWCFLLLKQKKGIRILCEVTKNQSHRDLFKEKKIVNVINPYVLNIVQNIHDNKFEYARNSDHHGYQTRRNCESGMECTQKNSNYGIKFYSKIFINLQKNIICIWKWTIVDPILSHAEHYK